MAFPFTFYSDVTETPNTDDGTFKIESPSTMRAVLLDGDNSIKGTFGGDLVFDNYRIKLLQSEGTDEDAGQDRGTKIEYGIDLIDFTQ